MNLLEVDRIRKSFDGHVAVDDLSFEIRSGEVLGLLGPNGAGKTTTMSIIAGLLTQDDGQLRYRGEAVTTTGAGAVLRSELGVVPQELAIYPDLTAGENLTFFGRLYHLRGAELEQRIKFALDRSGLTQHSSRLARTFSGGMQRRLNFACGLLHEPQLLMLDEPTVGVDPQSRAYLLDCVRQLRDDGVTVLYASHYMEEVEDISDRVVIIDHGKLVASGTQEELLGKLPIDIRLRLAGGDANLGNLLASLTGVASVDAPTQNGHPDRTIVIRTSITASDNADLGSLLSQIVTVAAEQKCSVLSVTTNDSNLERLFLELTGRRLRD
ncbi:MAG: ABC transporter ATP-binding protein [Planctomycetota bacterium]|nr:ABC transporter ATP-binding protein [Planctomycetota bacterium]MDA1165397.1 ABC transporter ATP-binding protein [Planctomycetota bacterium]